MNWFKRFFGGGGLTNPDEGPQASGANSRNSDAGVTVSEERAMGLSAVWSCVRLISETVGSLPLGVYERTTDGRAAVEQHYLYDLFRVAPNALMNPLEFREAQTLALALWGNGYSYIERDKNGSPVALVPMRPECVTPVKEDGTVNYYYQTTKGEIRFRKDEVFHLKGFSLDGIVGLSPLAYARHSMGISIASDQFAANTFAKGNRPSGVLTVDRILDASQREKLRAIYDNMDSNSLWVLEGGTGYQELSLPPDDMQMLESRQFQLADIARFFRVPSHMINDTTPTTSWGSGIEQLNLGFLTYTLRPYLTRWEFTVSNALLSRTDRRKYFVEHNVEGLLRADTAARANFYSTALQNGWMTRGEVRKKENLPKIEGTDDLTVQINLAPIDQLENVGGNQANSD